MSVAVVLALSSMVSAVSVSSCSSVVWCDCRLPASMSVSPVSRPAGSGALTPFRTAFGVSITYDVVVLEIS